MPFDNDGVIKANSLSLVFFCSNDVFLIVLYSFELFYPCKRQPFRAHAVGVTRNV